MSISRHFRAQAARFFPPVIVYGIIFYLSSRPASTFPDIVPDIVPHFLEYAILGYFFMGMVDPAKRTTPNFNWRIVGWSVAAIFLLAFLDELHQYFVPTRFFEIKDIIVDTLGGLVGLLLRLMAAKKRSK